MNSFKLRNIFGLLCVICSLSVKAQRNSEKGDRYFNQNQFESAIKYYLVDANSDNKKVKEYAMTKLGDCYRILGLFEKAEETYRKILKRKKKESENYLNYGLALKNSAKYAEAKLQFEEYIKLRPDDPMGNIYLQSCDSAQKWLDEFLGQEVKNIDRINTSFSEFAPYILGSDLYFSSSRDGSTRALISFEGGNDVHRMDLYTIPLVKLLGKEGNEADILNLKEINSSLHEGTPTFSKDGNEMYFSRTVKGIRDEKTNKVLNTLQIFFTKKDSAGRWTKPVNAFSFSSLKYSMAHPSLSKDGRKIYFMSDMPGGFGKTDIYVSEKSEQGIWSNPKNVGNKVNTFGYELFPCLSDSNTLYFSSNAHPGMGQLDIFKAHLINGVWDHTENAKPPLNSIGNDFGICFDATLGHGFFSSDRFNGKGSEDIYSFCFDLPVQLELKNDSIYLANNYVFDNIKYKLTVIEDSTSSEFPNNLSMFSFGLSDNKSYQLVEKKNGIFINQIDISKTIDSLDKITRYEIKTSKTDILLRGKFTMLNTDRLKTELNLFKSGDIIESVKLEQDGSFSFTQPLVRGYSYKIILSH